MNKSKLLLIALCGLLLSFSTIKAQQLLFINEFLASNTSCYADEYGDYDDWLEIYNAGTEPVDIGGMYITDKLDQPTYYQIPAGKPDSTTIPPGGYLVLWCDDDLEQGVLHVNIKLKGGGEQIGLYDNDGLTPIDTLSYDDQTTDISYGRIVDGGPDWAFFTNPTPGATNTTTTIPINLLVNEFLAINDSCCFDEFGDNDDFVEIYNAGTEPVDIGGLYITDKLDQPTYYQIPAGKPDSTTIPPGGFLVLWCDEDLEQGVLHVNIKLKGGGEQIGLYKADGITPIDTLTYGAQASNISYGRMPDGGPDWVFFPNPTPGASNIPIIFPDDLYINEFLALNDSCCFDEFGEDDDWVEIYNAGPEAINLGGMYLTDNLAIPKLWQIPGTEPDSTTIPPGGFLVIWFDNDSEQGVLHTEIKLSGAGEQIGLYAADGVTPIDTLSFGQQETNISYGRLPDGSNNWETFTTPTPGETNSANAIDDKSTSTSMPKGYFMDQNYPNPFNPATHISYQIPVPTRVIIKIYNIRGEQIKTLENCFKSAGSYLVRWNGLDSNGFAVTSGIYLCRIQAGDFSQVRKMLMVK